MSNKIMYRHKINIILKLYLCEIKGYNFYLSINEDIYG